MQLWSVLIRLMQWSDPALAITCVIDFPHTHGKLHAYAMLPCFNLFDHLNILYCRFVYGVRHCDWVMAVANVLLGFRRTMYVAWVVPRSAVFSELFSAKMSCPELVSAKLSCPRAGRSSWDVLFLNLPCVPAGPCRSFCPVYLCPHWTMLCVLCCVPVSLLVCAVCSVLCVLIHPVELCSVFGLCCRPPSRCSRFGGSQGDTRSGGPQLRPARQTSHHGHTWLTGRNRHRPRPFSI